MKIRDLTGVAALALAALASPALAQFIPKGDQLVEAIRKDDNGEAAALINDNPTLVNNRDSRGDTPLIVAIRRGDRSWTSFLIRAGADPDAAAKDGETPLIAATRIGFQDAITWLTGAGAKINAANKLGETPLIIGVQARNARAVRALLDAGADPDKADYAGYSARDYARRDTRSRQMAELIEAKKPKK